MNEPATPLPVPLEQRTMQNGARFASHQAGSQRPGAERRRERRYEVDLPGELRSDAECWPVLVSDLSASGALISSVDAGFPVGVGARIVLVLNEFGVIDGVVAHAATDFCGLQFLNPHLFRDKLMAWLRTAPDAA